MIASQGRNFALASVLMLAVILSTSDVVQAQDSVSARVGPPGETAKSGKVLENETKRVSSLLRCPVCQGLSIYDSPAPMAVNMRKQVEALLAKGYSQDQVVRYFESSYGEFVRLEPKGEGLNLLVWILPVAALLFGGYGVLSFTRKAKPVAAESVSPDQPSADLSPWIDRVRAVVRGEGEGTNAGV